MRAGRLPEPNLPRQFHSERASARAHVPALVSRLGSPVLKSARKPITAATDGYTMPKILATIVRLGQYSKTQGTSDKATAPTPAGRNSDDNFMPSSTRTVPATLWPWCRLIRLTTLPERRLSLGQPGTPR